MTLLSFCPRCSPLARLDYDAVPSPSCNYCQGTGYVKASAEERQAYWRLASEQEPPRA